MKLKFVGGEGEYVQGYPRRDIEIEDEAEARRLIETGCYVEARPTTKTKKGEVSDG